MVDKLFTINKCSTQLRESDIKLLDRNFILFRRPEFSNPGMTMDQFNGFTQFSVDTSIS